MFFIVIIIFRQQSIPNKLLPFSGGGSDGGAGIGHGGGNGGWSGGARGDGDEFGNDSSKSSGGGFGLLGLFLNGWRSRVTIDPHGLPPFAWVSLLVFLETWVASVCV